MEKIRSIITDFRAYLFKQLDSPKADIEEQQNLIGILVEVLKMKEKGDGNGVCCKDEGEGRREWSLL